MLPTDYSLRNHTYIYKYGLALNSPKGWYAIKQKH